MYMILWYMIGLAGVIFAQIANLTDRRVETYGDLGSFLLVSILGPVIWLLLLYSHGGNKKLPWVKK